MNDRKESQSTTQPNDDSAVEIEAGELPVFPEVSSPAKVEQNDQAEPAEQSTSTKPSNEADSVPPIPPPAQEIKNADSATVSPDSEEPPPLPPPTGVLGEQDKPAIPTPPPPPAPTNSQSREEEAESATPPTPPPPPPIPGEEVETMPGPPPSIDEPPPLADGSTRMLDSEPTTLDLFLEQAMPILAIERGMNARSRVKMEALAQSLGLPEDQFESAMGSLQGGDSEACETNPQAEAYRLSLRNQLPKLPQNILTPALESRAVEIGVQRYGLAGDEARQVIVEVCVSEKVQRISTEKAQQHIHSLVKQKLGDAAWLDDSSRGRLHAAGAQWGVTEDEVDRIIKQCSNANRTNQKKTSKIAIYSISGAGVVIAGLIVFLLVINNQRKDPNAPSLDDGGTVATDGTAPVTTDGGTDVDLEIATPPKWWNTDMAIARGRFISTAGEDGASAKENAERIVELNRIVSDDPAERAIGYEGVVRLVSRTGVPAERRQAAAQLLSSAYVLEPDEASAQKLLDTLWAQLPSGSKRAPTAGVYEHSFWVAATVVLAAADEELPPERETQLAAGASRHFGAAIASEGDIIALEGQVNLALSEVLYRQLINVATLGGKGLASASFALGDATTDRLKHDPAAMQELARLRSRLTAASLKGNASKWKDYEEAAETAIASEDAANVVALLEVYESTDVEELRQFLGQKLAARSTVERIGRSMEPRESAIDAANVEQVASYVRESFGIVKAPPPKTAEQRWRKLDPLAAPIIADRLAAPAENTQLLQAIVDAARLNRLACALTQGDAGFDLFDEAIEEEAPNVAEALSGEGKVDLFVPGERPSMMTESRRQRIDEATKNLRQYQSLAHATAISELRRVGEAFDQMQYMTAEQAQGVATFLIGPKTDDEHKDVLEVVRDAARFSQVKLALVDAAEDKRWPADRFVDVVNRILQTEIDSTTADWRQQVKGALLSDVLQATSPDHQSDAKTLASLGSARDAYLEYYRDQGALLGVSSAQLRGAKTTAEILNTLIARRSSGLANVAKSPADKQFAEELPELLELSDYVGIADLGRTAFLQRIWVRVLAIRIKGQQTSLAGKAQAVVDDLDRQDKTADSVLRQLRAGEIALLRLWMLQEKL